MVSTTPRSASWRVMADEKIDKQLLSILLCPKCKGKVRLNSAGDGLICDRCKLLYPVKDGIPIMLTDDARPLAESN